MNKASVLLERDGAVASVVFNRPAALNAINLEMAVQLDALTQILERDPTVRCVLLTSSGDHFMAGGDIREFKGVLDLPAAERGARFKALVKAVEQVVTRLLSMPKPVLASIKGTTAGFGLSLMCACDLAIAADNATFMLAYCQLGTSPDGSGTHTLPRLLGIRRAMGLAMLGDRLDAAQALDYGLVNRVVSVDSIADESARLAAHLATQPTLALASTKLLLNRSFDNNLQAQLGAECESFVALASSGDFTEGVNAFVARRRPVFSGR